MKLNPLIRAFIITFGATLIIGLLLFSRNSARYSIKVPKSSISNSSASSNLAGKSDVEASAGENGSFSTVSNSPHQVTLATNDSHGAIANPRLKAVTFPSGEHAEISPEGRQITLTDRGGKIIWSKDMVEALGKHLPMYFTGKIEALEIYSNVLVLRAGNEFIGVDRQNGEIISRDAR